MLNTQAKASKSLEVLFWVNRVNDTNFRMTLTKDKHKFNYNKMFML